MTTELPAEVFSPGEYLREELAERGWTQTEFAEIIGRPLQAVSEILNDKKEITTETALLFEQALGVSAGTWLTMQSRWRLFTLRRARRDEPVSPVARRSRLRTLVPLAEVRRRGWVTKVDDLDALEGDVLSLLEIGSFDEEPDFLMAAKRSNSSSAITIEQRAWLAYVRRQARNRALADYSVDGLRTLAASLPKLLADGPEQLRQLREAFASVGVALVAVEGLKGGKLDGAVTKVDDRAVIGLTARGDRYDSFIHTLLHECGHLVLGHLDGDRTSIVDDDMRPDDRARLELEANALADEWLFPGGFPTVEPSFMKVVELADSFGVHPSVVIGRFQWLTGNWKFHRSDIPKVRDYLTMDGG